MGNIFRKILESLFLLFRPKRLVLPPDHDAETEEDALRLRLKDEADRKVASQRKQSIFPCLRQPSIMGYREDWVAAEGKGIRNLREFWLTLEDLETPYFYRPTRLLQRPGNGHLTMSLEWRSKEMVLECIGDDRYPGTLAFTVDEMDPLSKKWDRVLDKVAYLDLPEDLDEVHDIVSRMCARMYAEGVV